jgi:hypothetical protein
MTVTAAQIAKLLSHAVMAPPQAAVSQAKLKSSAVMAPPQTQVSAAKLRNAAVFAPPQTHLSLAKIRVFAVITTKVIIVPDYTWPQGGAAGASALVPRRAKLQPMPFNTTGGQGFTNVEQVIANSPGRWRLDLTDVRVKTDAQRMAWEIMEIGLQGRAKTVLVPIFRWMTNLVPWPSNAGGIYTSASTHYATPVILAYAETQMLEGVVTGTIRMEQGGTLVAGHVFEFNQKVYFITEITAPGTTVTSPHFPTFTVKFWPPMRERIEINDQLEFDNPKLRCRLEKDDSMNIQGGWDNWRRGSPSVSFLEDLTE